MLISLKKLLAQILFWFYDFIDLVGDTFRVLIGLDPVEVNEAPGVSHSTTLLDAFMSHTIFSRVLLSLILAGIVIAIIAGIVKTIVNVVRYKTGGENKSHAKTLGNTFLGVIGTIACVFFVMVFMVFSNRLIYAVDVITRPNDSSTKYSSILFDLSVEETYEIDYDTLIPGRETVKLDEYGNPVPKKDANGNPMYKRDPDTGMYVDKNGEILADQNDKTKWVPEYETERGESYYDYKRDEFGNPEVSSGYRPGYSAADIDVSKQTVTKVFGRHVSIMGLESEWLPYITQPMVEMEAFNLFTAFFIAIILLFSFIHIGIGLVKRLYDIVVLITILPLVCGTVPLDEGARLKAWRDTFISKVLLALGAVIAMNVFFQLMPLINMIDFPTITKSKMLQRILKLFLIGGGALCVNSAQSLIARVLGTSADESREMAQSRGVIMSGAMAAFGMALGAKNLVFGGYNRYGRPTTGILQRLGNLRDNSAGRRNSEGAQSGDSEQSYRYSDSGMGRISNGFRQSAVNLLSGRGAGLFLGRNGNPDYHKSQRANSEAGSATKYVSAAKPGDNGTSAAANYAQPPRKSDSGSYRPNNTKRK